MAVTVLPSNSFWAALPNIARTGIESYERGRAMKENKEDRERTQALQQLGILQQAAAQGADVNAQISELLGKLGMSGVTPAETPQQLQQRIMNAKDITIPSVTAEVIAPSDIRGLSGDFAIAPTQRRIRAPETTTKPERIEGWKQFSDDQLRYANMPTRLDRRREQVDTGSLDVTERKNDILARIGRGEVITPQEAAFVGQKTAQQIDLEDAAQVTSFVRANAGDYVKEWLARNGGRITPQNQAAIIDQAYEAFTQRFGGKIPTNANTDLRAAFASAAYDVLQDQNAQDMARAQMELQRQIAALRAGRGGPEQNMQIVDMLGRMGNSIMNDMSKIPEASQAAYMTAMMQGRDPSTMGAESDGYKLFLSQMQQLQKIRMASAAAARGLSNDPTVVKLLDEIVSGGTVEGVGGGSGRPEKRLTPDGREIITPDEEQFLRAIGQWNPSKYSVEAP